MDSFIDGSLSRSALSSGRSHRRPVIHGLVAVALACALLAAPAAQAGTAGDMSKQAGLGLGAAISSIVYAPVKIAYAAGGLVVGGLAWLFSGGDNEVAKVVLTPSILGDYVLTPDQLVGDKPIEFFGRDPEYANADVASGPPTDDEIDRSW
jgi:hypothetical protein